MSFKFNGKFFEVVEKNGEKLVMQEKKEIDNSVKDYWEKTREETFSYGLLSLLNTYYGRELVARAEEALKIENYIFEHNLTELEESVRENIFNCFKEIDEYLSNDFSIKEKDHSLGKAYVEPMPTIKNTYTEASVGGVNIFE